MASVSNLSLLPVVLSSLPRSITATYMVVAEWRTHQGPGSDTFELLVSQSATLQHDHRGPMHKGS
jgi:hypothetical protein